MEATMDEEVKVIIGDSSKMERRLRNIEHKVERLFDILDNWDDISDVTVALNEQADKLHEIGREDK